RRIRYKKKSGTIGSGVSPVHCFQSKRHDPDHLLWLPEFPAAKSENSIITQMPEVSFEGLYGVEIALTQSKTAAGYSRPRVDGVLLDHVILIVGSFKKAPGICSHDVDAG